MIKGVICASILFLSYFAGYLYTGTYKSRVSHLDSLLERFLRIKKQMRYSLDPLPTLFRLVGDEDSPAGRLFYTSATEMSQKRGSSFSEIWTRAVEECFGKSVLKEKEKGMLVGIGRELGKTDILTQQQTLEHICSQLAELLEDARDEQKRNTKLYKTLFTAVGFSIVILLV